MENTSTNRKHHLSATDPAAKRSPWVGVVVVGLAQLMLQFNQSLVIIALPSAQSDLGMSGAERTWALGIYSLAFGGMLMAGGRVVDRLGRKRSIIVAMVGFMIAAAAGGSARVPLVLIGALAVQGACAAVQTPAQLATLSTAFGGAAGRTRAFTVYSFISMAGGTLGILLNGVITGYLGWRWCLFATVPLGIIPLLGAIFLLREGPAGERRPFDVPGAVLVSASMLTLMYGLTEVAKSGTAVISILVSLALLSLFVTLQARVAHPLMPLRILLDRNRGGANLALFLVSSQILSMNYFFSYYAQTVRHWSPAMTGAGLMPLILGLTITSAVVAKIVTKVPPRAFVVIGMLLYALAFAWLSRIGTSSSYATTLLPAQLLMGLGVGGLAPVLYGTATGGVEPGDSGAAGGIAATSRQMGAALGLAVFIMTAALAANGNSPDAIVHGYAIAAVCSAVILAVGAILGGILINARKPQH